MRADGRSSFNRHYAEVRAHLIPTRRCCVHTYKPITSATSYTIFSVPTYSLRLDLDFNFL
jgi:hypothetical protein